MLELVRQEGRDRFAEHGSGVVRGLEQGRDVQGQGHAQLGCVVLQFGEIGQSGGQILPVLVPPTPGTAPVISASASIRAGSAQLYVRAKVRTRSALTA
ncbi:hypothetical protein SAV31267_067370 [Streptomyces avermitilis]|uniref:Uncharacterized protein n=1 Tax=Streptomyces avermitilis TaxID=33903 RepID=A0A4D4MYG5_STRAX|nr:hypothetical protein SAV31267_067370 [Streptomyces avermitilis]